MASGKALCILYSFTAVYTLWWFAHPFFKSLHDKDLSDVSKMISLGLIVSKLLYYIVGPILGVAIFHVLDQNQKDIDQAKDL